MRKSKYTAEQIAYCVTQVQAGVPIPDLCRKSGISQQTFHRRKARYGGLAPSEVKELQSLREDDSRLKKLVADLSLDMQILQGALREKSERCKQKCRMVAKAIETFAVENRGASPAADGPAARSRGARRRGAPRWRA